MTANDSKSYLGFYISYFNKKVDKYNNTDHFSIGKKAYPCWLFCFALRFWRES